MIVLDLVLLFLRQVVSFFLPTNLVRAGDLLFVVFGVFYVSFLLGFHMFPPISFGGFSFFFLSCLGIKTIGSVSFGLRGAVRRATTVLLSTMPQLVGTFALLSH